MKEQCCERDDDRDGNCWLHESPGVYRGEARAAQAGNCPQCHSYHGPRERCDPAASRAPLSEPQRSNAELANRLELLAGRCNRLGWKGSEEACRQAAARLSAEAAPLPALVERLAQLPSYTVKLPSYSGGNTGKRDLTYEEVVVIRRDEALRVAAPQTAQETK